MATTCRANLGPNPVYTYTITISASGYQTKTTPGYVLDAQKYKVQVLEKSVAAIHANILDSNGKRLLNLNPTNSQNAELWMEI